MAVFRLAHFEIQPARRAEAEQAMHAFASAVRAALPGATWAAYRDPAAPARYVALSRADSGAVDDQLQAAPATRAFRGALGGMVVGPIEDTTWDLVTSSDLAPRHRPERRSPAARRRPR